MKSEIYSPAEDSYFFTQILEKHISEFLNQKPNLTLLEIGSGSGIHLRSLLRLGVKKQNIFSCDINPLSVRHCKKLGFNCIHSDLFSNVKGKFDVIIFNPPYLPENSSEPENSRISTTGGKLGSEIINEFLRQARQHLNGTKNPLDFGATKSKTMLTHGQGKDFVGNGKIFLLTSSLSRKINFSGYNKEIVAKKKLFFEELYVWELKITTK